MSARFRTHKSLDAVTSISHDCLRGTSFFKGRNPEFLEKLTEYLQLEVFFAGSDILTMGATGDKMYFLHRGEVEVLVGPELKSVAKLGSGSIFGEMALFGSQKRTATVRAVEFCDCRAIHHTHFQSILKMFPAERRYFEKLYEERTLELQRVQQHEQHQRRRRSSAQWLAGFFTTLNEESSKVGGKLEIASNLVEEEINITTKGEKDIQRRRSISGVHSRRRSSVNHQHTRRHSISSCIDSPENMLSTLRKQSHQDYSLELQPTLLPVADDITIMDFDDQETKIGSSEETSSSGCPSSQTSNANSPQARLPDIAIEKVEVLQHRDYSQPEPTVGLQKMRHLEGSEQNSEEVLAEMSKELVGADLPAMTASSGKVASETESGACSPERKKSEVRRPSKSLAPSLPSPGIVRRLSNVQRAKAKTLEDSPEQAKDVMILPTSKPIRRAKTLDEGHLEVPPNKTQSSTNRSWSVHGRSVVNPMSSQWLRDKMKHDNAMLREGIQELSRSRLQ